LFGQREFSEEFKKEETELRKGLYDFITEMKQYMTDNDLVNDGFMKNLCDDIYICYRTFGTKFGTMYVGARQTSQGTQRSYTVSHTPDDINEQKDNSNYVSDNNIISPRNNYKHVFGKLPVPNLRRHSNFDCFNCTNLPPLEDLSILHHELSDFTEAPYLTPTSAGLMREISCNISHDEETQHEL
jgi:hypothetical protein